MIIFTTLNAYYMPVLCYAFYLHNLIQHSQDVIITRLYMKELKLNPEEELASKSHSRRWRFAMQH